MSVNNTLQRKPVQQNDQVVEFEVNGDKVKLTPATVKNYLVSGNKENVTMQELAMFINLCKFSKLNPWVKEAYCIKYGNEPATMVVGKEAFQKRAEANPNFDGFEAGIIVMVEETGEILYRKGTMRIPGEEIIGGYAEVWRKDRSHSTRIEVSFEEYAGRKKDGTLNGQWSKKPATMIRKVALVQALRETFPSSFSGMYAAEEQGYIEPEYNVSVVNEPEGTVIDMPQEEQQSEKTESSEKTAASVMFGK
jgi:phage recombination protein Bet